MQNLSQAIHEREPKGSLYPDTAILKLLQAAIMVLTAHFIRCLNL